MEIVFQGAVCHITWHRYANGQIAMQLWSEGSPYARATTAVDGVALAEDEVLIKDYSENEGMLAALEAARIVKATGHFVRSGYVAIPVAKLLVLPTFR